MLKIFLLSSLAIILLLGIAACVSNSCTVRDEFNCNYLSTVSDLKTSEINKEDVIVNWNRRGCRVDSKTLLPLVIDNTVPEFVSRWALIQYTMQEGKNGSELGVIANRVKNEKFSSQLYIQGGLNGSIPLKIDDRSSIVILKYKYISGESIRFYIRINKLNSTADVKDNLTFGKAFLQNKVLEIAAFCSNEGDQKIANSILLIPKP